MFNNPPVVDLAATKHATIDVTTISVSGLSSGGFMAKGGGIFAGGPFNIAYNTSSRDFLPAYAVNVVKAIFGRSHHDLRAETVSLANEGIIDPVVNINGSKSYVYQGSLDPINFEFTGLSRKVAEIYKHFGSNVKFLHLPFGTHTTPTDNFGGNCAIFNPLDDGVNNCGIESIFEMFKHFYGKDYKEPTSSSTPFTGTMNNFDQNLYAPSGKAALHFMNDHGGIYIPLACQRVNASCRLHVAFHGCGQTIFTNILYDQWAVNAGYLQVADKNRVIVVFPRSANFQMLTGKVNIACWDWFGGTTISTVPYKRTPQVQSVTNILNAIIGTELFN